MKHFLRIITALVGLTLLVACGSKKHAVKSSTIVPEPTTTATPTPEAEPSASTGTEKRATCITSRIRLELSSGSSTTTVGGTLRMKRDDVIQLSVVTFGIIEVARIEMTPDNFMLIDKMGKRFVRAAYTDVDFLKASGVDFSMIQKYFWDETSHDLQGWERSDYVVVGGWNLPTNHKITIQTSRKTLKANLTLSSLSTDEEWEKHTDISSKYTQVPVDELLSRILNLTF